MTGQNVATPPPMRGLFKVFVSRAWSIGPSKVHNVHPPGVNPGTNAALLLLDLAPPSAAINCIFGIKCLEQTAEAFVPMLNLIDEFTQECLAIRIATGG